MDEKIGESPWINIILIYENGEKNIKEDQSGLKGDTTYTVIYNVPLKALMLKFQIGNLELDLQKVLSKTEK